MSSFQNVFSLIMLDMPNAHLHLYGKREVRMDRKMGNITTNKNLTGNVNMTF